MDTHNENVGLTIVAWGFVMTGIYNLDCDSFLSEYLSTGKPCPGVLCRAELAFIWLPYNIHLKMTIIIGSHYPVSIEVMLIGANMFINAATKEDPMAFLSLQSHWKCC